MKIQKDRKSAETEDSEHQLFNAFAALKNSSEVEQFLRDLCTPAELQAMADRWRVVEPIKQGRAYRQIYDATGVSVTTVGRVARFISQGNGGYNLIYQRLKKRKKDTKTTVA